MNSLQKVSNTLFKNIPTTLVFARLIRVSYIIGSIKIPMYFSLSAVGMPVAGRYASLSVFAGMMLIRGIMAYSNPWGISPLVYFAMHYLPGFGAALSMRYNSWLTNIMVPLVCMLLFNCHPIAGQVGIYSLYWLIPIALHVVEYRYRMWAHNHFVHALRATFVAHAIGSVLWAYGKSMTVAQWHLLLPLAALERIVFAAGIAFCCMAMDMVLGMKHSIVSHKQGNSAIQS